MLKRFSAYFLIFSLLAVNFSRFFVFAGFELNKNYIAAKLCENRNKPWLHCNGKCYFAKKIKQAQENEKKETAKDNFSRLEVSFFQEPFKLAFIEPVILEGNKRAFPQYTYQYKSHYIDTIFHPPKSLV
ncbi:hypothetical protein [Mucilaginibacter xinganensis]|uniref:Uncharacterized protein n=1 Tax=Mucilaginibacter xinganensis TaxID=1234841 RepID=A0A223NSE0_9SPHI|nr:hypothetical protein [Mucilaginibacter xinganensis]ASU32773.1 hypothetical protein MuYL_0873 [Mucilaginibacter xinganensis]